MSTPPATPGNSPSLRLNSNFQSAAGAPPSPELNVEDLLRAVAEVERNIIAIHSNAQVFKAVRDVFDANTRLRSASEVTYTRMTSVEVEKIKLQEVCDKKNATIARLEAANRQLLQKVDNMNGLKESLKKEKALTKSLSEEKQSLEKDKQNLAEHLEVECTNKAVILETHRRTQRRLDRLESFALPPTPMAPEEITRRLDAIFQSAFDFINACFSQDLDIRSLGGHGWNEFKEKFREHLGTLPLAGSNSPDAKRMRTAAVLCYLGYFATQELFQPEYTLQKGSELGDALYHQIDDPDHANFVRRQLLRMEDEDVVDNIKARVDEVKKTVNGLVWPILAPDMQNQFSNGLERWCEETVRVWRQDIQPLPHGIMVDTDLEEGEPPAREWKVMAAEWMAASAAAGAGTASGSGSGSGSGSSSARIPSIKSANDVAACIWPVFVMVDADNTVARQGLVLTKAQIAEAKKEEALEEEAKKEEAKKEEARLAQVARSGRRRSRAPPNPNPDSPTSQAQPF
ncbi:hypothetical protein SCUCBS95973_006323 [Sporothrix curviconia]|uniref:MEI5 protein n=1 Tax=Sporothrix curviconia TaxID=1260050 RepID=A0ABP0C6G1_9PEZI